MQIHKSLIAAAAMLTTGHASALDPKGYQGVHTSYLVEFSSVDKEDPLHHEAMGFCLGYINAALNYHAALTTGTRIDPIACLPSDVTREAVVVYIGGNYDRSYGIVFAMHSFK